MSAVSSFSIPRVAIPATLRLTAGDARDGQIYVMERVPQHAGPETPLDMLNRAEGFFPFRSGSDATVLLVAKARTVVLTVPPPPADLARLSAAKQASLVVTLADGSELSGWATLELPEHHSRVLDYLNAAEPFFAIATADQVHIVNRAHVLFARPKD
jgi:hypothetical protein